MKRLISLLLAITIVLTLSVCVFADQKNDHINSGKLNEDIIAIASTQIGYISEDNTSKYDSAVSGTFSNWSASFLAWCANEASAPEDVIPRIADVKQLYEFYEKNVSVYSPDEKFPAVGDLIFLSENDEINLCGIVVSTDDEYVTAIVGGEENAVRKKMYELTLDKIYAYASPDYTLEAQHKPGKHMTTASVLNIRAETTTSSQVVGKIPLGTVVTITSISGEWGKITYNNIEGWINLQYAVPYDDTHSDTSAYAVKWNVIDISKWQGNINWDKIKSADIDGVIIRIGLRGTATKQILLDDKFFEYYEGAVKAGLHIGCYFYSAARTTAQAKEEANFVIKTIRDNDLKFDMPVYLDMEDKVVERTGKTQIFNSTKAFLDIMKKENIYSGVYCSTSWAEDYYNPALFNGHALWIADWRNQCEYSGEYGMWQYTERGSVSGIDANYTDLNICYINYPELIADKGYNKLPDKEETTADKETTTAKKETTTADKETTTTDKGNNKIPDEDISDVTIEDISNVPDENTSNIPDENNQGIPGDVNADGKITAADARLTLRASAKLQTLTTKEAVLADINSDGKITASDARKILRISAKLE